jgi:hypothetical protein
MKEMLTAAKAAKLSIAGLPTAQKNAALEAMADALIAGTADILAANALDLEAAQGTISPVMLDRLRLTEERILAMANGIREVAQLPDPVGGIVWFGTDDAATSPLTPIYCGSTEVPECLSEKTANILTYSDRSMFWITNRIAQFAYLRYDYIGGEVRKVIDEWENAKLAEVAEVDAALAQLGSEKKMKKMATKYSVATAQNLWEKWSDLDDYLMVKYIDGNIKKQDPENGIFLNNGHHPSQPAFPDQPGYSEKFLRAIANDNPILKVVK